MLGLLLEKITVLYNHDQTNDNSPLMNNFRDQFKLWKDAIDRMISTPLEKFDPSVVAALNTAWEAGAQAQQARGTRMGDRKKKTLTTTAQPGWLQKTMNIFGVPFAKKDFTSDPLEVSIRRPKSNWVFLSVFKTIFIFILLAFAAYNFYDDDFTGTFSQLFGMFVAAFSMDFTIDNVTTFPGKKDNS